MIWPKIHAKLNNPIFQCKNFKNKLLVAVHIKVDKTNLCRISKNNKKCRLRVPRSVNT